MIAFLSLVAGDRIEQKIRLIRGQRVLLDSDLAGMYEVPLKRLNEQVRRNLKRFPPDFMFQLSMAEVHSLRSQFATLERAGKGQHRKYRPLVFTEQGVAMLSSVLRSEKAVQVNIAIVRAFVQLRQMLGLQKELAVKLAQLEQKIEKHSEDIQTIFQAIHQLMTPPEKPKRKIGFHV